MRELERHPRRLPGRGAAGAARARTWAPARCSARHERALFDCAAPADERPIDTSRPLALHRAQVLPEWVDYNGHAHESRYLQVFGDASTRCCGGSVSTPATWPARQLLHSRVAHLPPARGAARRRAAGRDAAAGRRRQAAARVPPLDPRRRRRAARDRRADAAARRHRRRPRRPGRGRAARPGAGAGVAARGIAAAAAGRTGDQPRAKPQGSG